MRARIWRPQRLPPAPRRAAPANLSAASTQFFPRRRALPRLDRLLARLRAQKDELLMVLKRPDIPLHTNGSEYDIRCQVTRRKVPAAYKLSSRDRSLWLEGPCDVKAFLCVAWLYSRVNVIATFEMSVAPVGLIVIDCRLASIDITRSAVNGDDTDKTKVPFQSRIHNCRDYPLPLSYRINRMAQSRPQV